MITLQEVLLVDDDPINIRICKLLIQKQDFSKHCSICFNGQEALDYLKDLLHRQQPFPELIFLDLNMPVMNGWDFLNEFEALKVLLPSIPKIIVLTSSPDPTDVTKAFSYSSVVDFISKPLSIKALTRIGEHT